MKSRATLLAITPGDPAGIGPEVVWKTLRSKSFRTAHPSSRLQLLCVGARAPFEKLGAPIVEISPSEIGNGTFTYPDRKSPFVWLLAAPTRIRKPRFLPGYQSGWAIAEATGLVLNGHASALVTGPISKERLQRGGYPYAGHTEFLADLCKTFSSPLSGPVTPGTPPVTMMLANSQLRVTLVTTHISIRDVPGAITSQRIERTVIQTDQHLREDCGISHPRIAVTALNPHAGEAGLFGREEIEIIEPALADLRRKLGKKTTLIGPLPADTLFANQSLLPIKERYDAVVCMYHDQGLIPVKQLDFKHTVNVTLGLPIVRTSVDHGTAFDIAGKNLADPSSFQSAVDLAIKIVQTRRKGNL